MRMNYLKLLDKDSWEIVVLDINMPGKSGLEALKEMKTREYKSTCPYPKYVQ